MLDTCETTRRFTRSTAEAFKDQRAYCIETHNGTLLTMSPPKVRKAQGFWQVYRLYRRAGHSVWYCTRMAWNIVVKGWSF